MALPVPEKLTCPKCGIRDQIQVVVGEGPHSKPGIFLDHNHALGGADMIKINTPFFKNLCTRGVQAVYSLCTGCAQQVSRQFRKVNAHV